MKLKYKNLFFILFCLLTSVNAQEHPKREFRGAWINTVHQSQYQRMDRDEMKAYFIDMLDSFQKTGINALIFQIRPESDAFYSSKIEPWSRFLTGEQGVAPAPLWDPLTFLVEECHARNIEFHAWLNPYRVSTASGPKLADSHIYHQHPEWFVSYANQLYFDPGRPESRQFICKVVSDIVSRYDIDAIHMDDYFYPYPVGGASFPDNDSYAQYGNNQNRGNWRRSNVNVLIKSLQETIKKEKPWVRFGISPFGIYRNNKSDADGSATNGLQNYDDLYADVLLWTRKGWVDYLMPQLYWEIGHKAACSETLIYWWNAHHNNRHLYIGQDVKRTMDAADLNAAYSQLNRKMMMSRYLDHISGNCFWPGYTLMANYKGVSTQLQDNYFSTPALIPAYTFLDTKMPAEVSGLKTEWSIYGYKLIWKRKNTRDEMQRQVYFCVYRFADGEPVNLEDGSKLVATTRDTEYLLPYKKGTEKYTYVVTAVDRMHNESSKGKAKKIQL